MKAYYPFFVAAMLVSGSLAAQSLYKPGIIHVKVSAERAREFEQQSFGFSRSGHVSTGIGRLDIVNERLKARTFTRIFSPSGKFEAAHRAYGLHLWYAVVFDSLQSIDLATQEYQRTGYFEKVERVMPYVHITSKPERLSGGNETNTPDPLTTTNDPLFDRQWHYKNTGQTGGSPGADIALEQGWAVEQGKTNVVVAVIDGGIDINHPDLTGALWINTDELPGNGRDDDLNGYIDDVNGYGFGDNTGTIYPNFHGTHVAGTIGAITNNGVGVSGIAGGSGSANGVRLMSCAGFGEFGVGGFENAMVYAADNGAVISQNSWGGGSSAIEAAIDYFVARAGLDNTAGNFSRNIQIGPMAGGIVIFAAGNGNSESPSAGYPGSYRSCFAVASTDHNDVRSTFSNFGSWVELAAPGSNVYSTYPLSLGGYEYLSGTSMACPHVSGVAALIISKFGGAGYVPNQVWDRLIFTADNIDSRNPGFIGKLGGGRLNSNQALESNDGVPPAAIGDLAATDVRFNALRLAWTATGSSGNLGAASFYDLRVSTTPITESNFNSSARISPLPRPLASGSSEVFHATGLMPNTTYYFALKAGDFFGNQSPISNIISATTPPPPIIRVTPASLSETLLTGAKSTRNLLIENQGGSRMDFRVFVTVAAPTAQPQSVIAHSEARTSSYQYAAKNLQISTPQVQGFTNSPIRQQSSRGRLFSLYGSTALAELDPATGAIINQITLPEIASGGPDGLAFDGTFVYFINSFGSGRIHQINPSTGIVESSKVITGLTNIDGLAHDGASLYALDYSANQIIEVDYSRGEVKKRIIPGFDLGGGITFGGSRGTLFVSNFEAGIYELDIATGRVVNQFLPSGPILGLGYSEAEQVLFAQNSSTNQIDVYDPKTGVRVRSISSFYSGALASDEGGSTWLTPTLLEGTVGAGESLIVPIDFNANGLLGGLYRKDIVISSDDPVTPSVAIPASLTVIGAPNLSPSETEISFGEVYVGLSKTLSIQIGNNGTDDLVIDSVRIQNPVFSQIGVISTRVRPGETQVLRVRFRPSGLGAETGEARIFSNDPDLGLFRLPLAGVGVNPPVISVSPDSLGVTLFSNDTATRTLSISNSGGSQLTFSTQVIEMSQSSMSTAHLEDVPRSSGVNNTGQTIAQEGTAPVQVMDGVFTTKASSSLPLTCLALNSATNTIYAQGNQSNSFYRYLPNSDSWEQLASCPIFSGNNGGAVYLKGKIYTTYTGTTESGIYDIATNQWTTFSKVFSTGNITTDGTYLYFAIGYLLYRHNPESGVWESLPNSPIEITPWGGAAFSNGELFVHVGNSYSGFAKLNLTTNSWTVLPSIPGGAVLGSAIDGTKDIYYAYGSYGGNNLYAFDIRKNEWSFVTIPGFTVNDGGMCFIRGLPHAGLYMVEGESGYRFIHFRNLSSINWIRLDPFEGSVQPAQTTSIHVTFDATGLFGGDYPAKIEVTSNDSIRSPLLVPVNLRVIGVPDISTSPDSLGFGEVFVTDSRSLPLNIANAGTDLLSIRSISLNNPEFSLLGESMFDLAPGETRQITIKLAPVSTGLKTSELVIQSNDPDEPVLIVPLGGSASRPPIASLIPHEKTITGESGSIMVDRLSLNNAGPSALTFNSLISYQPHDAHSAVDTFFVAPNSPARISALVTNTSSGLIFAQESWSTLFYEFNPSTGDWMPKAPSPLPISNQAKAVLLNNKIYVGATNRSELCVYLTANNTWSTISGVHNTSALTTDGRYLYSVYLQDLRRFDPENNSWVTLAGPPFVVTNGGLEFFEGNLYCHGGWANNEFARYSIATNSWTILSSLAISAGAGSTFDFHSRSYVALASDYNNTLLSYSLTTQSWTYTPIPLFAPAGSGVTFYPYGLRKGVYFTEGYPGNRFGVFQRSLNYWLTSAPGSGIVAGNNQLELVLTANALGLAGGVYNATVHFFTNDPANRTLDLPVTLHVQGRPEISVSATSLDFGSVFSGQTSQRQTIVYNLGTDTLRITGTSTTPDVFSTPVLTAEILPGESRVVTVNLLSNTTGTFAGRLQISSNDSDEASLSIDLFANVVVAPRLQFSPMSISMSLLPNNIRSSSVTISNTGGSPLQWSGSVGSGSGVNQLEKVKSSLDLLWSQVTSVIPARFDFFEGETGTIINDGGNDMFDGGNLISVNQSGGSLSYTNGEIVTAPALGTGGRYFTRKYQGLFALAADLNGVNTFTIDGNLGADGAGFVDQAIITVTVNGVNYTGFVKRVFGAGDPSVNHLIIVASNPNANHRMSSNSDQDFHEVFGLAGANRLYYLLFAGINGTYIDNAAMTLIMTRFLSSISTEVDWIRFSTLSAGSIEAGTSHEVSLTINSTGLAFGSHTTALTFRSNDPLQHEVRIPVTVQIIDNEPPRLSTPITPQIVPVNGTVSLNLAAYITDPNNQALQFEAEAGNNQLCEFEIIGSVLTITGRAKGLTEVTVTAIDPAQARMQTDFTLTVTDLITSLPESPDTWVVTPNPASREARVHFSLSEETLISVSIFDATGRETPVLMNESHASGRHSIELPVERLVSGSYIVRLVTAHEVINKHLIILR
jgi:subtilisin family serine protease